MTQLWDRGTLDSEFPQILADAASTKRPLGLIMMDIDHFKKVNDTHGHPKGDAVLAETAERIISIVEGKGRAYRYGGEEIAIFLPNHNTQEAIAVAERTRRTLERAPIGGLTITASFGVAVFPDHVSTGTEIVSAADKALYEAKNRGRNLVRVFDEPPPSQPEKPREPERKTPTPGGLTEGEKEMLRLEHFKGRRIACPKDGALLAVRENQTIGNPRASLFVLCKMCGWNDQL
jgi:diguanylate cyclase (GGDEF)-like protein